MTEMRSGKLCAHMTHTKDMQMESHANTCTLSTSKMLTSTILANNMIYGNLYHITIFQNTHLVAYDKTYMHTPPKVFIQLWRNVTQLAESKTRGI